MQGFKHKPKQHCKGLDLQIPAPSFPQTASILEICISGRPCNSPRCQVGKCCVGWRQSQQLSVLIITHLTAALEVELRPHWQQQKPQRWMVGNLCTRRGFCLLVFTRGSFLLQLLFCCCRQGGIGKELHTWNNSPPFHPKTSKPLEVLGETLHCYRQGKQRLETAGAELGTALVVFKNLTSPSAQQACKTARKALQYLCKQRVSVMLWFCDFRGPDVKKSQLLLSWTRSCLSPRHPKPSFFSVTTKPCSKCITGEKMRTTAQIKKRPVSIAMN